MNGHERTSDCDRYCDVHVLNGQADRSSHECCVCAATKKALALKREIKVKRPEHGGLGLPSGCEFNVKPLSSGHFEVTCRRHDAGWYVDDEEGVGLRIAGHLRVVADEAAERTKQALADAETEPLENLEAAAAILDGHHPASVKSPDALPQAGEASMATRAALEFYAGRRKGASATVYEVSYGDQWHWDGVSEIMRDKGDRARAALPPEDR